MGSVNTVRDPIGGLGEGGDEAEGHPGDGRTVERCFDCRRDPPAADSCTTATITFPDGDVEDAIRYGASSKTSATGRCPGCGVSPGGFHHPFCPVEACPRCGGRLATCACLDTDRTRC